MAFRWSSGAVKTKPAVRKMKFLKGEVRAKAKRHGKRGKLKNSRGTQGWRVPVFPEKVVQVDTYTHAMLAVRVGNSRKVWGNLLRCAGLQLH